MTRLLLSLLALAFGASPTLAQGPSGYLGRLTTAELGVDYNLFGLIDGGEDIRNVAGPGVSANVARVVGRRLTLGAYARIQPLRSELRQLRGDDADLLAGRRFTAATFALELGWSGSKPGLVAPVGLHYTLGFGYTALSGGDIDVEAGAAGLEFVDPVERLTEDDNGEPQGSISASIGAGFRYVYADRYTVVPFLRLDFGTTGLGGPVGTPIGAVAQTGVRIGSLF